MMKKKLTRKAEAQAEKQQRNTVNDFPPGWDEGRVRRVLAHYESQTDEEAAAEDEAAFSSPEQTVVQVPVELVPLIRELIGQYQAQLVH